MSRPGKMKLALKAEQAFGIKSLPVRRDAASNTPSAQSTAILTVPQPTSAPPVTAQKSVIRNSEVKAPAFKKSQSLLGSTPPAALIFDVPITGASLSRNEKIEVLRVLDESEVRGCIKCRLCEGRTHTVFGEGDPDASIFFVGEGPGENEDLQARPFVGRAGEMLNKWITGMGLAREQVYIANIVKCRPPKNRVPAPDEVATCTPYLTRQLEIIRPKVIITLGLPSAQHMLGTKNSMGSLRGRWQSWRGIKVMPTYHPAYVLRSYNQPTRAAVWSDLQQVMSELNLPLPARKSDGQN